MEASKAASRISTPGLAYEVKKLADTMARANAKVTRARFVEGMGQSLAEGLEEHRSAQVAFHAAIDHMAALLAERDELAKDAARYRWLRNEAWGGGMAKRKFPHVVEYRPGLMPTAVLELAEEALDAAIDAALTNKD